MCYKIVFGLTCIKMNDGHPYKLFVPRAAVNTRKHCFCVRLIEQWNSLDSAVVDFSTLRRFKCSLRRIYLSPYLKYFD